MVVTIDLKCYSKLQYDISKYHEKTPADPLKGKENKGQYAEYLYTR